MDIPILKINANNLENLIQFIYSHEELLKHCGALKIQLEKDCKLALRKRHISLSCQNTQQIMKINSNEFIYSIQTKQYLGKSNNKPSLILPIEDENLFWSNLSECINVREEPGVSILENKSLFRQRFQKKHFGIHRLPKQSLLKLGGTETTGQFLPFLIESHGFGAVIPLNCAQQRLSSLIYHHTGGARHWYIIPNSERLNLEKMILKENLSICLDHSQSLIDPKIFDKYNIRYHKIIQYPSEFVILSSGCLSQSFFEASAWNESIDFALPDWIQDGHAYLSCQCPIKDKNLYRINLDLFRNGLVQRYIYTNLKINPQQQQVSTLKDSDEKNSLPADAQSHNDNYLSDVEKFSLINVKPVVLLDKIKPFIFDEILNELIMSPISNSSLDQYQGTSIENDYQNNYSETLIGNTPESRVSLITLIQSVSTEYLCEPSNFENNESYSTFTFNNLSENIPNDRFDELKFLLDTDCFSPSASLPTYCQTDNRSHKLNNNQNQKSNSDTSIQKNNIKKHTLNRYKTLFVSGLKSTVSKRAMYRYFVGSIKVTFKKCKTASDLRYAFVLHRTFQDAQYNLRQPVNRDLLGRKCDIAYADSRTSIPVKRQLSDKDTIVVKQIPGSVTENDLKNLFGNCTILKYCPSRYVGRFSTETAVTKNTKALPGFALLRYENEQEAANVVKHADWYKINGTSLHVSAFRKTKR